MQNFKYCPICGSKNEEFENSSQINEIKREIKESNYYKLESRNELDFLIKSVMDDGDIGGNFCPNCGAKNSSDAIFCMECANPLKDVAVCPNCGGIAQSGDMFCSECGTKL